MALARPTAAFSWALGEVKNQAVTYLYVTLSTMLVFVLLGRILGRKEDQLLESALQDPLTGLWNRRHFHAQLELELARARRYGRGLALLLLDVDGLKGINDAGGHGGGDEALRAVAAAMKRQCRRSDLAARVGGDEFAVLAPETSANDAMALADRIRSALANEIGSRARRVTISVGVAGVVEAGSIAALELYAAADEALYEAKKSGRDRAILSSRYI
jgi:diguanylate cyclase (GGDEF)-like protein